MTSRAVRERVGEKGTLEVTSEGRDQSLNLPLSVVADGKRVQKIYKNFQALLNHRQKTLQSLTSLQKVSHCQTSLIISRDH